MSTFNKMRIVSLIFVVSFLCRPAFGQQQWISLKSGCEVSEGTFHDNVSIGNIPRNQEISYSMIRCDPRSVQIRILGTADVLGKENAYAAYSVREVAKKTGASIVVNAGSTASYSVPIPAGLLIVGGVVRSKPNLKTTNSGILCVQEERVVIEPLSPQTAIPKGCSYAIQRGPVLSQDFVEASGIPTIRTVAAIDAKGRLIILVTRSNAFLSSIKSFLYDPGSNFEIRSALNLDGDMSSGLMFAADEGSKERAVAFVDNLVASVIVITRR